MTGGRARQRNVEHGELEAETLLVLSNDFSLHARPVAFAQKIRTLLRSDFGQCAAGRQFAKNQAITCLYAPYCQTICVRAMKEMLYVRAR
jgi:hypothetical protein